MNRVELKVLGSVSPYCKGKCNCSGYLISDNNSKILLDCGFGVSRELKFPDDLNNLSIIISHYHKDHFGDLFAIKYAIQCYKNLNLFDGIVNLYIPKSNDINYKYIINECKKYFNIVEYDENSNFKIEKFKISFFKTVHSIDNYSVRIVNDSKIIIYSGDMGYHKIDEYCNFCKNADIFICESTFLMKEEINNKYHLHTNEAVKIAINSNVKKLILTHMWPEHNKNLYLNEVKKEFSNVSVAKEKEICII